MAYNHREYTRRWYYANPERVRAHRLTHKAIRLGQLVRQPCEKCGAQRADAHHSDYAKPLEVRWLCRRCHNHLHEKYPTHCSACHQFVSPKSEHVCMARDGEAA